MQGTRPPGQEIDPSPHQCRILSSLDMGHTLGLSKEEHVYEVGALPHYQNLYQRIIKMVTLMKWLDLLYRLKLYAPYLIHTLLFYYKCSSDERV